MPQARALIVDDSRTAQIRLKKLLSPYDLHVDTAGSAEQALSYLSYQVPSVIFMDHLMTGMDGFEAIKVIKANPETATIPIIMYTSKSGDMYLGQARALGAVGVLSKDTMGSANLSEVLKGSNIYPKGQEPEGSLPEPQTSLTQPYKETEEADTPKPSMVPGADTAEALRKQVAKSLEISLASVRHEIAENSRQVMGQMVREIQEVKTAIKQTSSTPPPPPKPAPVPAEAIEPVLEQPMVERSSSPWQTLILLLVLAVLAWGVYQTTLLSQAQQQLAERLESIETPAQPAVPEIIESSALNDQLLNGISWMFNQSGQLYFGERLLSRDHLARLAGLVHHLDSAGFEGVIALDVHYGNYCVSIDDGGEPQLAADDTTLAQCTLLSDYLTGGVDSEPLSLGLIEFLESSPVLESGRIQVELNRLSLNDMIYDYPAFAPEVSAGDWNQVASSNHRVDITLVPAQ